MGKPKKGLLETVSKYKNDCMYVFDAKNRIMLCECCNARVNWEKASTVNSHISSATHNENRVKFELETERKRRQVSIATSLEGAERIKADKEEFIESTVRAFMRSNIPLKKLDDPSIRAWMRKYVKGKFSLSLVNP